VAGGKHIEIEKIQPKTQTEIYSQWFFSFVGNYRRQIFWAVLYTLVLFGVFIERGYCEYSSSDSAPQCQRSAISTVRYRKNGQKRSLPIPVLILGSTLSLTIDWEFEFYEF